VLIVLVHFVCSVIAGLLRLKVSWLCFGPKCSYLSRLWIIEYVYSLRWKPANMYDICHIFIETLRTSITEQTLLLFSVGMSHGGLPIVDLLIRWYFCLDVHESFWLCWLLMRM
jgi:hypothetical protein